MLRCSTKAFTTAYNCGMAELNPYETPKITQPCDPSIAPSVAIFMAGLPFVILGGQGVAACFYWFVLGEYDSGVVLLLVGVGAACSLTVGLVIWRLADMLNPRKSIKRHRSLPDQPSV